MKKKSTFLSWFRRQNLGRKILYAFILSSVIPLLLVQGIMLYINTQNMTEKMNEIMENQLAHMAERVNLNMDIYTSMLYQIYTDNDIISNISLIEEKTFHKKAVASREILDRIQQYGTAAEGIVCISIILSDGEHITYDFREASAVKNLWSTYDDYREIVPYQNAQSASGVVITPTEQIYRYGEERVFHISKAI